MRVTLWELWNESFDPPLRSAELPPAQPGNILLEGPRRAPSPFGVCEGFNFSARRQLVSASLQKAFHFDACLQEIRGTCATLCSLKADPALTGTRGSPEVPSKINYSVAITTALA